MKKIVVSLLVVWLLASVSLAAKAPTAKAITSKGGGMKIGLGTYLLGGIPNVTAGLGVGAVKFSSDTFNGAVGLNFASISANNATNTVITALGLFTFNITGGIVPTHAGGGIMFQSIPNGSGFTLVVLYGAETYITNNLVAGFDVIPVGFTSVSQNNATATTFFLGSASVYTSYIF